MDITLTPVTGQHHWAHLQLAPATGSLHAAILTPIMSLPCHTDTLAEKLQQHECVLIARAPQLLLSLQLAWSSADSLSPCHFVCL